jgi:hypothetical protein
MIFGRKSVGPGPVPAWGQASFASDATFAPLVPETWSPSKTPSSVPAPANAGKVDRTGEGRASAMEQNTPWRKTRRFSQQHLWIPKTRGWRVSSRRKMHHCRGPLKSHDCCRAKPFASLASSSSVARSWNASCLCGRIPRRRSRQSYSAAPSALHHPRPPAIGGRPVACESPVAESPALDSRSLHPQEDDKLVLLGPTDSGHATTGRRRAPVAAC